MPEVLDQSEVDSLLAAAANGLASVATGGTTGDFRRNVAVYDFKRPERVSKDQMRALEGLHDGFARNFGASFSGYLRTIVETRVAICEQLTYNEFIRSLPTPTCFNLLNVPPLSGQMCLEISPLIIYPIIDRLLGGHSIDTLIPQRALTNIEQRLVNRITERVLKSLSEVWSQLAPVRFELAETESNPQLVQIVAPNEVVVVVGFEIKMGPRSGTMSLCIPFAVIEPIIHKLATQSWLAYSERGRQTESFDQIRNGLAAGPLELRAYLARTRITVKELFELSPGDLLKLDKPIDSEMFIQIDGRNKFAGRLAQARGNRVVRLTRTLGDEEAVE